MQALLPPIDCLDLIDLMLTGEGRRESFIFQGVLCSAVQIDGERACLEALSSDFGVRAIFQDWYRDEHREPVLLIIAGDLRTCLQWLPLDLHAKISIINEVLLSEDEKVLCRLSL